MDFNSLLNVSEVPQNDRTAAFVAESRENRRRCYEMSEQMTMAVAADGEKFQQYGRTLMPRVILTVIRRITFCLLWHRSRTHKRLATMVIGEVGGSM